MITWDITISNADESSGRADVSFTRTDSAALAPEIYSFQNTLIKTLAQRWALIEIVKMEVLKKEEKQTAMDVFIGTLIQNGVDALTAWEATR